jgi:hypothetical protein
MLASSPEQVVGVLRETRQAIAKPELESEPESNRAPESQQEAEPQPGQPECFQFLDDEPKHALYKHVMESLPTDGAGIERLTVELQDEPYFMDKNDVDAVIEFYNGQRGSQLQVR